MGEAETNILTVLGVLIGIAVTLIVFHHLVKGAIKEANKRQVSLIEAQTRILIEIARQQGVEEGKIAAIQDRLS